MLRILARWMRRLRMKRPATGRRFWDSYAQEACTIIFPGLRSSLVQYASGQQAWVPHEHLQPPTSTG